MCAVNTLPGPFLWVLITRPMLSVKSQITLYVFAYSTKQSTPFRIQQVEISTHLLTFSLLGKIPNSRYKNYPDKPSFSLYIICQKICYDKAGNLPNKGRNFNTQTWGKIVYFLFVWLVGIGFRQNFFRVLPDFGDFGAKISFFHYIINQQETAKDGVAGLQSGNKIWEDWLRTS